MALLALYERFRPWQETDDYIVAIILALLLLLVVLNRGKSFLANGVFAGCVLGCLSAASSEDSTYSKKMSFIEWGILFGFLLGSLARIQIPIQETPKPPAPATKSVSSDDFHGPVFWVSALAISGVSAGLTLAVFFTMTYHEMSLWIAGLSLMGYVVGSLAGPICKKTPWVQVALELWICLALSIGTGAIVGWKFVLPILMFDVNPPVSTEVLFREATYSCAAAGGLIGVIAWMVKTVRRKRESHRDTMASLT